MPSCNISVFNFTIPNVFLMSLLIIIKYVFGNLLSIENFSQITDDFNVSNSISKRGSCSAINK